MFLSLFKCRWKHTGKFIPSGNQRVCTEWLRGGFLILHTPKSCGAPLTLFVSAHGTCTKHGSDEGPGHKPYIAESRTDLNNQA